MQKRFRPVLISSIHWVQTSLVYMMQTWTDPRDRDRDKLYLVSAIVNKNSFSAATVGHCCCRDTKFNDINVKIRIVRTFKSVMIQILTMGIWEKLLQHIPEQNHRQFVHDIFECISLTSASIGSGNGLAPGSRQLITRFSDDPFQQSIVVSPAAPGW